MSDDAMFDDEMDEMEAWLGHERLINEAALILINDTAGPPEERARKAVEILNRITSREGETP